MRFSDTKRVMTVLFVIDKRVAERCWVLLCVAGMLNSAPFEVDVQNCSLAGICLFVPTFLDTAGFRLAGGEFANHACMTDSAWCHGPETAQPEFTYCFGLQVLK